MTDQQIKEKAEQWAKGNDVSTSERVLMSFAYTQGYSDALEEVCQNGNPWPLSSILAKLIEATNVLLHKKDYDGPAWEEMSHCVKRGEQILQQLNHPNETDSNQ